MLEQRQTTPDEENLDVSDLNGLFDPLNEDSDDAGSDDEELTSEPLFSALLRQTIRQLWDSDPVVLDFVDYVAGPISDHLGHVTAKGGDFVIDKAAEGADVTRYQADQSMRAHLINGLFPVLHIAHTLQAWGAPQFRYYDDTVRRIFIAGYVLHDLAKVAGSGCRAGSRGLKPLDGKCRPAPHGRSGNLPPMVHSAGSRLVSKAARRHG